MKKTMPLVVKILCAEEREEESKSRSERGGGEMEAAHIHKDKEGK